MPLPLSSPLLSTNLACSNGVHQTNHHPHLHPIWHRASHVPRRRLPREELSHGAVWFAHLSCHHKPSHTLAKATAPHPSQTSCVLPKQGGKEQRLGPRPFARGRAPLEWFGVTPPSPPSVVRKKGEKKTNMVLWLRVLVKSGGRRQQSLYGGCHDGWRLPTFAHRGQRFLVPRHVMCPYGEEEELLLAIGVVMARD